MAEARGKNLESALPSADPIEDNISPIQQQTKMFNIKARDILNAPGEPSNDLSSALQFQDSEAGSITNRSMIETKIFAARTTDELLTLSTEQDLTLKHACVIISRLGGLVQSRGDPRAALKIQMDIRFVQIFNLIQRGNHSQFPHTLLQALTVIICEFSE